MRAERLERMADMRDARRTPACACKRSNSTATPLKSSSSMPTRVRSDLIVMGGEARAVVGAPPVVGRRKGYSPDKVPTLVVASDAPGNPTVFRKRARGG